MYHRLAHVQTGHFSTTDSWRVDRVRIQNSTVKSLVPKLPTVLPNLTWLSIPLKVNACPALPLVKDIPFIDVLLLLPVASLPLPSPFHQLTKPVGMQDPDDWHLPAVPAL